MLVKIGAAALLLGAIDPLEGSVVILAGCVLLLAAAVRSRGDRRSTAYWAWVCGLVAAGVAAMWVLSALGGIGGSSGRSPWWGLLILPYLAGWWLGIRGPGLPRWTAWAALIVGLWYLAIATIVVAGGHDRGIDRAPALVLGALGALIVVDRLVRLGSMGRTANRNPGRP